MNDPNNWIPEDDDDSDLRDVCLEESYLEHDCPKDKFLEDPITTYYGVGGEMVDLVPCPICDAREQDGLRSVHWDDTWGLVEGPAEEK
jgi:hypothetical protein